MHTDWGCRFLHTAVFVVFWYVGTIARQQSFTLCKRRLANVSDATSSGFHPCEGGGNETVGTFFSGNAATCDNQFLKLMDDPEVLFTAKNGSYVIMVGGNPELFLITAYSSSCVCAPLPYINGAFSTWHDSVTPISMTPIRPSRGKISSA